MFMNLNDFTKFANFEGVRDLLEAASKTTLSHMTAAAELNAKYLQDMVAIWRKDNVETPNS